MSVALPSRVGRLDEIRQSGGPEACLAAFSDMLEKNRREAFTLLNGITLYPTLYILLPRLDSRHPNPQLSPRIRTAVSVSRRILTKEKSPKPDLSVKNQQVKAALQWMLKSSTGEFGLDDDFRRLIDVVASVLMSIYRDKKALASLDKILFGRARHGQNVHDLSWAFFKSAEPLSLELAAEHLRSTQEPERCLACLLLNIDEKEARDPACCARQYEKALRWLKENGPYLYFTGESMQYKSNPSAWTVDLERKYLRREDPSHLKSELSPRNGKEGRLLAEFKKLSTEDKKLLGDHSHRISLKGKAHWEKWAGSGIQQQLARAKEEKEELP